MEGLELLGDLRAGAHDLLEKLGIGHGGHRGTRLTLAVGALPAAVAGLEGCVLDVATSQLLSLVMPSSCAAKRVFSLLSDQFSKQQSSTLGDMLFLSLFIAHNKRVA